MMRAILCVCLAATVCGSAEYAVTDRSEPLMVMAGHDSEIDVERYVLASSQQAFDEQWIAHQGDRVARAAQGWPMTPQIDFESCAAIFIFGGDAFNSNGFRVVDIIEGAGVVKVRFEPISFQTSSLEGEDPGIRVRPWAMVLIERTDRTIILEEDVQGLIGGEPIWKVRATFPDQNERPD